MDWKRIVRNGIGISAFCVCMLILSLVVAYYAEKPYKTQLYGMYKVIQVDGGENIVIDKGFRQQREHLIGIDAGEADSPEEKVAREYVEDLIEGKEVSVEYDNRREKEETKGIVEYCYMYLDDGRMLNALLLAEGMADYNPDSANDRYDKQFKYLRDKAKHEKKGIWEE